MAEAFSLPAEYEVVSGPFRGGMGCVYCVRHRGWDALLAVKQPRPETLADEAATARFLTECRNWIALGLHANVVLCHYVRVLDGVPTIFAEWVDGGSLSEAIRSGRLYEDPDPAAVQVRLTELALQLARGMAYAHSKGLIHRDLKPGNILLTRGGTAKVTDFGLSVLRGSGDDSRGLGTAAYAAPEQQRGGEAAEAADLWSFGLVLLELFAGGRRWTSALQAAAHLDDLLACSRAPVPAEAEALIRSCCALRPADRPAGFAAAEKLLLRCLSRLTGETNPLPDAGETALAADNLNNRALSYLALGQNAEAEACWTEALRLQPGHPAASYNRALERWRSGAADDIETLRTLQDVCGSTPGLETAELLLRFLRERKSTAAAQKLCVRYPALQPQLNWLASEDARRCVVGKRARQIAAAGGEVLCLFADGSAELWDALPGGRPVILGMGGLHANALHLREGSGLLLAACDEGLALFDRAGKRTALLPCVEGALRDARLLPDGTAWIHAARRDGDVWKQYYIRLTLPDGHRLSKLRVTQEEGFLLPLQDGALIMPAGEKLLRIGPDGGVNGVCDVIGAPVRCAALSADERLLAVHGGSSICILGTADGTLQAELSTGPCTCLAFTRGAELLLTGTGHGEVRLWELSSGRCLRTFALHRGSVACLAVMADGDAFFSAGGNEGVLYQHIPRFDTPAPWKLCRAEDTAALHENDRRFRSLLREATVLHRAGDRAAALQRLYAARDLPGYARHEAYLRLNAAMGKGLSVHSFIAAWLRESLAAGETAPLPAGERPPCRAALSASAASADGYVAEGGFDSSLTLRQSPDGRPLWRVRLSGQPTALCFSPVGGLLIAGMAGGSLRILEAASGRLLQLLSGSRSPVTALRFTPDGLLLRADSEDGSVRIWQLDYEYALPKEERL